MSNELTLATVQSQLTKSQKLTVDEGTIEEINKLANDPDYGPEFMQSYLEHLNVLAEAPKNNHTHYLNAMKFFSLVEAGNSLNDAYVKVFPERFKKREEGNRGKTPDEVKHLLRGEASRYNASKILAEIRRVATIPVHLIYRHLLHTAIETSADLMLTAKSEMVRQKAADTIIRELKPQEDAVLAIKVDDGSISVIESLRNATQELAAKQHEAILAGVPIKQIAAAKIMIDQEDIIEGAFEEEIIPRNSAPIPEPQPVEIPEEKMSAPTPRKKPWKL